MQQVTVEILECLMLRLCKEIPVKLTRLAPLAELSEILSHEKKLLSRMSHHESISDFQVGKFLKAETRHFI